jgi:hypothetical protein
VYAHADMGETRDRHRGGLVLRHFSL